MARKDAGRKEWDTVGNRDPDNAVALARFGAAFAHPLRVQILQSLADKPGSATTISKELEVALGNVAHHLKKVLYIECGYVEPIKERRVRGATEHTFQIDSKRLLSDLTWSSIAAPLRPAVQAGSLFAFAEHAVASLGNPLATDAAIVGDDGETAFGTWRPGAVDQSGWRDILGILVEANQRIASVLDENAERLVEDEGMNVIFGLGAFETVPPTGGW